MGPIERAEIISWRRQPRRIPQPFRSSDSYVPRQASQTVRIALTNSQWDDGRPRGGGEALVSNIVELQVEALPGVAAGFSTRTLDLRTGVMRPCEPRDQVADHRRERSP